MTEQNDIARRTLIKSSVFGILSVSVSNVLCPGNIFAAEPFLQDNTGMPRERYPAIPLDIASEVVGVSHFNLERLKELVEPRPELAKATWDWGFGDWEQAIGAASHAGRKDIAEYLISKGAIPTIFTYAMLGAYETVKGMIDFYPGIQKNSGPHGISLLQHAKTGLEVEGANKSKAERLITYLLELGNADGDQFLNMEEREKQKYLGDYKYGEGKDDGFTIKLNMRKLLSLGKIGKFGGALYKIRENEFTYNGAPSVMVSFQLDGNKVTAVIVNEPGLKITALKV